MQNFLRSIISEELGKVFSEIKTADPFFKTADLQGVSYKKNPKDDIIYNYEEARIFATNRLKNDIAYLGSYDLYDYIPLSVKQEKWAFDFETTYRQKLDCSIYRIIAGNKSYWSLYFGKANPGERTVTAIDSVENVLGYDAFVEEVNKKIGNKMDVEKY